MAAYIVRVELRRAGNDHYDELHDRMRNEGFSTTLPVGSTQWKLPSAEYYYEGSITSNGLMEKAEAAIRFYQHGHAVIITEAVSIQTAGLKQAAESDQP